jgi:transcriptional regulator of acetoin/glycerol metabolism
MKRISLQIMNYCRVEKQKTCRFSFETQKDLQDKLKKIINEPENIEQHQEMLLAAVNNYDKIFEANSEAVRVYSDWAKRLAAGGKQHRCLHVEMEDGMILTVGYKEVARAAKDSVATAKARKKWNRVAMLRDSVVDQILDKKNRCKDSRCPLCACLFTSENKQVDHCGEFEFRHIEAQFGDRDISEFPDFHRVRAELQVICRRCNQAKNKK